MSLNLFFHPGLQILKVQQLNSTIYKSHNKSKVNTNDKERHWRQTPRKMVILFVNKPQCCTLFLQPYLAFFFGPFFENNASETFQLVAYTRRTKTSDLIKTTTSRCFVLFLIQRSLNIKLVINVIRKEHGYSYCN